MMHYNTTFLCIMSIEGSLARPSQTEALTSACAVACIEHPIFRRSSPERSISMATHFCSISGGVSFIRSPPFPYLQVTQAENDAVTFPVPSERLVAGHEGKSHDLSKGDVGGIVDGDLVGPGDGIGLSQ